MKRTIHELSRVSRALLGVLAVTLALSAHTSAADAQEEQPFYLAVVTQESDTVDDSLTLGLSDLVEHHLRQLGTRLVERRSLWPLLREQQLQDWSANTVTHTKQKLPGVTHFVVVGVTHNDQGHRLLVTLIDRQDGHALVRLQSQAISPELLGKAAQTLANKLHEQLPEKSQQAATANPIGFTKSPEVASVFYQGMAALSNEQLPEAVGFFSMAYHQDKTFYLSRVWQARALERMGMHDFVDSCLSNLRHSQSDEAAALLSLAEIAKPDRLLLLPAETGASASDRSIQEIAQALAQHPEVDLLGAGFLAKVVRENDLALSGAFKRGQPQPERWLAANAMLGVDDQHVQLLDTITGHVLAQAPRADSPHAVADALIVSWRDSPAQQARAQPFAFDPSTPPTQAPDGMHSPVEQHKQQLYSKQIALSLRMVLEEPNNLDYLNWLYATNDHAFSPAQNRMRDLLLAHPDYPHASIWLSGVEYNLFENRFHRGFETLQQRLASEGPLAERYRVLLERYPDSTSAWLLRMGIGYEFARAEQHDKAIEAWLPLWERWHVLEFPEGIKINRTVYPRLSYLLARSLLFEGRVQEAQRVFEPCRDRITDRKYLFPYAMASITRLDDQAAWYFGGRRKLNHTQIRRELLYAYNNSYTEARLLAQRLDDVAAGRLEAGPYQTSRDLFLQAVFAPLPKAIHLHMESLRKYATELEQKERISMQAKFQLAFVCFHARTDEQMQRVDEIVALIEQAHGNQRSYELMEIVGQFDRQRSRLDSLLRTKHLRTRISAIGDDYALNTLQLPITERAAQLKYHAQQLEALLEAEEEEPGDARVLAALTIAPAWMNLYGFQEAQELYQQALAATDIHPFDRLRLELGLAQAEAAVGQNTQANDRLRAIIRHSLQPEYQPEVTEKPTYNMRWSHRRLYPNTMWSVTFHARRKLQQVRLYGPLMSRVAQTTPELPEINANDRRRLSAALYLMNAPKGYEYDWRGFQRFGEVCLAELIRQGPASKPMVHWLIHARDWNEQVGLRDDHLSHALRTLELVSLDPAVTDELLYLMYNHGYCGVEYAAIDALWNSDFEHPLKLASTVRHTGRNCTCNFYSRRKLLHFTEVSTHQITPLLETLDHPDPAVSNWSAYALAAALNTPIPLNPEGEPDPHAARQVRMTLQSDPQATADVLRQASEQKRIARRSIGTAAFARNRPVLAAPTRNGGYALWSLETQEVIARFQTDLSYWPLRLSDDGQWMAGNHEPSRRVEIWHADTGQRSRVLQTPTSNSALRFSPDAKLLHVGLIELMTYRLSDGQLMRRGFGHRREIYDIHERIDTQEVITTGRDFSIQVWSPDGQQPLHELGVHENSVLFGELRGNQYLTPSWDDRVSLWDLDQKREVMTYQGHKDPVFAACFIKGTPLAASMTIYGKVHIWSLEDGTTLHAFPGHIGQGHMMRSYEPGSFWTVGSDGYARQWHAKVGRAMNEINLLEE